MGGREREITAVKVRSRVWHTPISICFAFKETSDEPEISWTQRWKTKSLHGCMCRRQSSV